MKLAGSFILGLGLCTPPVSPGSGTAQWAWHPHQHQPSSAEQPQSPWPGSWHRCLCWWTSGSRLQSAWVQETLGLFLHSFTKAELAAWLAAPSYKYPRKTSSLLLIPPTRIALATHKLFCLCLEEEWSGHGAHVLTGTWLALPMSNWHFFLWKTKLNGGKWDCHLGAVGVWSYWGDGTLHARCSQGELLSQTQLKIFWTLKCQSCYFAHSTILVWDWLLNTLPSSFPLITQPW